MSGASSASGRSSTPKQPKQRLVQDFFPKKKDMENDGGKSIKLTNGSGGMEYQGKQYSFTAGSSVTEEEAEAKKARRLG
jgi:hypothetical protein